MSHRYRTLLIDPPWKYGDAGARGGTKKRYLGIPIERLRAMPLADLATADSHLYLWATNSFLGEALALMAAWGWSYKTTVTWVKMDPATSKVRIGNGHYFRASTEHCLFGVRGKLAAQVHNLPTHFFAPRGEHSSKPPGWYAVAEKMSPWPRLELFARGQGGGGWRRWGDQATPGEDRVILPALDAALVEPPVTKALRLANI